MSRQPYRHPEFPAFRRQLAPMKAARVRLERLKGLHQIQAALEPLFPKGLLHELASLPGRRIRWLPLTLVFWTFLSMILSPGTPCREAQRSIQAWWKRQKLLWTNTDSGPFCIARRKLPIDWLKRLWWRMAEGTAIAAPSLSATHGRRVVVTDGTTLLCPDTESNQKAWPQPSSQKPGCGFPQIRVVGAFCLKTGVLLKAVCGAISCSEQRLFAILRRSLRPGDIVLGDRGFWSFGNLALLSKRSMDAIFRAKHADKINWRKGKRLGAKDRLVTINKPKEPSRVMSKRLWMSLPKVITVRQIDATLSRPGFRSEKLVITTTLLDPIKWPASVIIELYQQRWRVELNFRDLKTTMKAEMLRCQSPEMIYRELLMLAIAYNLVRRIMIDAEGYTAIPVARMSFKGSLDTVRQWASVIAQQKTKRTRDEAWLDLLLLIGLDEVPHRPGRSEPRCVKRRPKPYQLMTAPRRKMKISKSRSLKGIQKPKKPNQRHKSWRAVLN